MEKYLPVGTVVMLKDAKKEVMIIGYLVSEEGKQEYDYMGVAYPEGMVSRTHNVAFNHDQIEKIVYKGYETEKYKELNKKLLDYKK